MAMGKATKQAVPSSTPTSTKKPNVGFTLSFPVKKRRKLNVNDEQSSCKVLDKCYGLLNKLENEFESKESDYMDLSSHHMESPTIIALAPPTSNNNTNNKLPSPSPAVVSEIEEVRIFEYVSKVLDYKEENGITNDYKENVIELSLS